jgi:hypothetical protein
VGWRAGFTGGRDFFAEGFGREPVGASESQLEGTDMRAWAGC